MPQQDIDHLHGPLKVVVTTGGDEGARLVHRTQSTEYHHQSIGYQTQTADGGKDVITEKLIATVMQRGETDMECLLLGGSQPDAASSACFDVPVVEVEETVAQTGKNLVERFALAVDEYVFPDGFYVHLIEHEAAEQSVFGILYQRMYLAWSAAQRYGHTGLKEFHKLTVGTATVADGFVMEAFAQTVVIVAIIAAESVGKRIAFGLEHEALTAVVVQRLIHGGGTAVGRQKEGTHGRLLGRHHAGAFVGVVGGQFFVIALQLLVVLLFAQLVDGHHEVSAQGHFTFPAEALPEMKRKRLVYTTRSSYTPCTHGRQAERVTRVLRKSTSRSSGVS